MVYIFILININSLKGKFNFTVKLLLLIITNIILFYFLGNLTYKLCCKYVFILLYLKP